MRTLQIITNQFCIKLNNYLLGLNKTIVYAPECLSQLHWEYPPISPVQWWPTLVYCESVCMSECDVYHVCTSKCEVYYMCTSECEVYCVHVSVSKIQPKFVNAQAKN